MCVVEGGSHISLEDLLPRMSHPEQISPSAIVVTH